MTRNHEPARREFVPGDPDASFQADDGPQIPARFRVYPEPVPESSALGYAIVGGVCVWVGGGFGLWWILS